MSVFLPPTAWRYCVNLTPVKIQPYGGKNSQRMIMIGTQVIKCGFLRTAVRQSLRMSMTANYATAPGSSEFGTLNVSVPKPFVYHVQLNRPKSLNAVDRQMWMEIKHCFNELGENPDCRVVLLSGAGRYFNAGIDVSLLMSFGQKLAEYEDVAQKCKVLKKEIGICQESLSAIELCPKPVIAAVHGACIGAGMGMITAADIRYCTKDAWFQVKEVLMGLTADIGTLQRMPKIMGSGSLVRELVYTGRKFDATEALHNGLVSKVYDDGESLLAGSISLAEEISAKSPVAVQGSKLNLNYSRDHTVQEGLDHVLMYNQVMLQSEDLANSVMAQVSKSGEAPVFSKL
ncbi:delta(3,5)-Delta(2,4)-dienoyl-CoA isomerase, mitochondrial isoform X1 [Neodiprion fabricii]|uniref:delta(3,5)-Delta(2,4)-dienoyl-CoA isomerase, mitochondrial isoform X1 n=3 Tax=Neodiprion TaxID=270857 RepID=UPI001ED967D6|nr:delta(3,5)-Delta(2,4)-dienoyl-CoA isomerase, mitochondrial isoform X1 [Neodiprion fabricii]